MAEIITTLESKPGTGIVDEQGSETLPSREVMGDGLGCFTMLLLPSC